MVVLRSGASFVKESHRNIFFLRVFIEGNKSETFRLNKLKEQLCSIMLVLFTVVATF